MKEEEEETYLLSDYAPFSHEPGKGMAVLLSASFME